MFRNAFHVEENVFCFFCLKIVGCLLTGPFYIWLAFTEVGLLNTVLKRSPLNLQKSIHVLNGVCSAIANTVVTSQALKDDCSPCQFLASLLAYDDESPLVCPENLILFNILPTPYMVLPGSNAR